MAMGKPETQARGPEGGSAASPPGRSTRSLAAQPAIDAGGAAGSATAGGSKQLPVSGNGIGGVSGTAGASDAARGAQLAHSASKAGGGLGGDIAGRAVDTAVAGDGSSAARNTLGRYAGAAASGAVSGAQQGAAAGGVGAAPGAVAGAVKGVSQEGVKDAVGDLKKGEDSKLGRTATVAAPVAAAPSVGAAITSIAFLNWLKSMFFSMLATAANLGKLLWHLLVTAAKAVGHAVAAPFMFLGGMLAKAGAGFLGIGVSAVAVPVLAIGSGAVATVTSVALVVSLVGNLNTRDDGLISDKACLQAVGTSAGTLDLSVSANVEANAKTVYSVFKAWGMPEENIAGILGNWSLESGIDPTSVESIHTEPYQIGPRKQAAWDSNFTQIPGQSHGGIGLGQWSNDRTIMLLDYAAGQGKKWFELPTQLAFMVQGDNPADAAVVRSMISTSQGSPSAAAHYFHDNWERSADTSSMRAQRAAMAEQWFSKMSGWTVDPAVTGAIGDITGGSISQVQAAVMTGNVTSNCGQNGLAGFAGLTDGGLNQQQADALMATYNAEGNQFLWDMYHGGGPGQCNGDYVQNCVSFSTYFMNRYTSFMQYAPGNGISTASAIASMTGKQVTSTPTAYSVFSHPSSTPAGHTGVVLAVVGDRLLTGEAGYCSFSGRTHWIEASEWQTGTWQFVDVSDLVTDRSLSGGGPARA